MTAVKKATIGGLLTKRVLGIDPEARFKQFPKDLRERAKETIFPAQLYWEEEPTVTGWLHDLKPTKEGSIRYTRSLFPSLDWVPRYNWRWLFGDAIAGEHGSLSIFLTLTTFQPNQYRKTTSLTDSIQG